MSNFETPERSLITRVRGFLLDRRNQKQYSGHRLWQHLERCLADYDKAPKSWNSDHNPDLQDLRNIRQVVTPGYETAWEWVQDQLMAWSELDDENKRLKARIAMAEEFIEETANGSAWREWQQYELENDEALAEEAEQHGQ